MSEIQFVRLALFGYALTVVAAVYFAASYLEGCPA